MRPKKENTKNSNKTRDVGTDPLEPLEFNPFDVDDRKLIEDWNWIPPVVCEALEMLKTQNTTGAPKFIKDKVIEKMEQLIQWMDEFTKALNKARTVSHRLQCIEHDTREAKTWAQQIAAKN